MMPEVIKMKKSTDEGVKGFLKGLLQSKKVEAVLVLTNKNNAAYYSLVKDAKKIDAFSPIAPVMPSNAATLLSKLTSGEGLRQPIAAVVRPCEERAFVELVKLQQGNLENVFIISMTCGGVYPLKLLAHGELEEKLPGYYKGLSKTETSDAIRDVCKGCLHFIPCNADFTINILGKNIDNECEIVVNTDKGKGLIEGIELPIEKVNDPLLAGNEDEKLKTLKKNRDKVGGQFYTEYDIARPGMKGLIDILGRCVGCHSCSKVCPICYCNLCNFDSDQHDCKYSEYMPQLKKRGSVRVPPNTLLFHTGRLNHVSISCVGCGMCEDVCPVDIPLSTLFSEIGKSVQSIFDYVPGKDPDEDIPISTFEEEELT